MRVIKKKNENLDTTRLKIVYLTLKDQRMKSGKISKKQWTQKSEESDLGESLISINLG